MLEAFDYLAKRDNIKEHVRKKAQDILKIFMDELEDTKTVHKYFKINTKKF